MLNALLLIVGFVLLIFGADKLVDGASALARKYNIPNIVIGLTIVAFGTSAPELVVNVFAAVSGNTELMLGNVLGSNIFNALGILGICAVMAPLAVKRNTTWIEIPLAFLAAIVVLVIANDVFLDKNATNITTRSEGVMLLFFFVIFLVYNLQVAKSGRASDDIETKELPMLKSLLFIVFGLTGLVIGGRMIVTSAVEIAQLMGISERIIALTIVAVGTSLPELATSVVAVRKGNTDIAIGNVVGSNIFNIFFIFGVSSVIAPSVIGPNSQIDIFVNILASLLLFFFIFTGKGRKLERWEGILFLFMYVAYLVFLIYGA
jgi:cation:H+ antiporter